MGEKVDVQYSPEHEADIRHLLGNRAELRGEITYDRRTQHAKAIRIREIVTGDQLGLDFSRVDFWTDRPVSELIAEAGAEPVENPADLEIQGVSEESWTASMRFWAVPSDPGRPPDLMLDTSYSTSALKGCRCSRLSRTS